MKMFGYVRGLYDLERMAELYGWQINSKDHCNKGSDFVYLFHEERDFLVAVNIFELIKKRHLYNEMLFLYSKEIS